MKFVSVGSGNLCDPALVAPHCGQSLSFTSTTMHKGFQPETARAPPTVAINNYYLIVILTRALAQGDAP